MNIAMEKCDLEGVWLPTSRSKWRNGFPHHSVRFWHTLRARMPQTKLTFDEYGRGEGWVGESYVRQEVSQIAPGKYCSVAYVKHVWIMGDGHLTILPECGSLEVHFPAKGIKEYWKREDGRSLEILQEAKKGRLAGSSSERVEEDAHQGLDSDRQLRPVRLMYTRNPTHGVTWQWGLSIGESIYEVAATDNEAFMIVYGPGGVVVTSGSSDKDAVDPRGMKERSGKKKTALFPTGKITNRTNAEVEEECQKWVSKYPVWKASGPNCQTFSEDLFEFLTGGKLPFKEMAHLRLGPEKHAPAVWLRERNKPGDFTAENIVSRWVDL